jgi:hypothetical protein
MLLLVQVRDLGRGVRPLLASGNRASLIPTWAMPLFAALNVLDGTVIGQNRQRHRHQEFIRFLNRIEREVPADKAIHAGPSTSRRPRARGSMPLPQVRADRSSHLAA